MVDTAGQFRRFMVQRIACETDDAEQPWQALRCALLRPVERRALRIGIDEQDTLACDSPLASQMERESRLSDAALLIEQRDDHRVSSTGAQPVSMNPKDSELALLRGGNRKQFQDVTPCFGS